MATLKRKIGSAGTYSSIITLPRMWLEMHNVSNGDYVSLILLPDGSLNLKPNKVKVQDATAQ